MIKGIGVDICDLRRLKHFDLLAKKILHPLEFNVYQTKSNDKSKKEYLGGRFAVKEAYIKAIGPTNYQDICCLNDEQGKPYLLDCSYHISISHENDYVVAFIVAEY